MLVDDAPIAEKSRRSICTYGQTVSRRAGSRLSSADALTNLRKLRVFRARTTTSHSHILAPRHGRQAPRARGRRARPRARAPLRVKACTLAQLRQKIVAKVLVDLPGWGPGVAESDVEVSLNGDEDLGAAGHDESATLRACGVTRGDLIRVKMRGERRGRLRRGRPRLCGERFRRERTARDAEKCRERR